MQEFLVRYSAKSFKRGDTLLEQGQEPAHGFAIEQGAVKVYNLTINGQEKPIQLYTSQDIFPLEWIMGKVHRSRYYYEVVVDSSIRCIPLHDLLVFLRENPQEGFELLERAIELSLHDQLRLNALEQSKASDKILSIIHYFALRFGRNIKKDIVEISLPLTQQDIANFTGLTRETVSTEFKRLADLGVISYHNHNFVVMTDKLEGRIDDDYELQLVRH